MKTNQDRGDAAPFTVPYSANGMVDRTDQGPALDRAGQNGVFKIGNAPSGVVAQAIASRGPFPLRTLIVCFTIWLIATQAMIFDQLKFAEHVHLLEEATRPLGRPLVVVPNEPPSNLSTSATVQRL